MWVWDRLRWSARAGIRQRARDHTHRTAARSALVVSPHPDDETLGCGATIARKLAAGAAVTVLMVTDGRFSHQDSAVSAEQLGRRRQAEAVEAMRRLGLPEDALRWAGLVDGAVADREAELAELIAALIAELRPAELYVTCADEPHPDHAAAGRAARRAAAAWSVPVWEYPIWLWGSWPLRAGERLRSAAAAAGLVWRRQAVVVRAGAHATSKQAALQAYGSQLNGSPQAGPSPGLPPSVLDAAAEPVEMFLPASRPAAPQPPGRTAPPAVPSRLRGVDRPAAPGRAGIVDRSRRSGQSS